ncbi:type I-B CRISPR-associated protein Cas7/Csh2 [Halobaculum gomorrense]|uniref:CRISPR-associated protein Csh2 n=1 Tax=Halobaculum gomorrense TaxID=43928 RepID=A0A1M5US47_9EURY|nr:type I-B CRISPR-associated protein Cas7/Csh2 [Halobaculum gomorrense]SHH65730.1 CRISPR-associated protein Csh2 [Halobaculum gomorrense]
MSESTTTVENRSEIVFLTDAQDCNPNGNPLGENRPRVDQETGQGIVTDVRLKRYLRDQLVDDGHSVFVRKTEEGKSTSRAQLALNALGDIDDPEEVEAIENVRDEFLDSAVDVRYFGATLSFNADEEGLEEAVRSAFGEGNYTGPVQFSPARSLNAVQLNEESNTLTSVIATGTEQEVGGFGLDDHRIKYGLFPFHGVVNEHGAHDTHLSAADVKRLDTLCWRAMKNQTISRSKVGQEPRLYLRAEFQTDGYHVGDLHNGIQLDTDNSKPDRELRNVTDVAVDVTALVDRLASVADHIETVHVIGDEFLDITYDGDTHSAAAFGELLEEHNVPVHEIDVYDEFKTTLPPETDAQH